MSKKIENIEERISDNGGITYRVHIPYTDDLGVRRFYSKSFSEKKYGTKQRALESAKKHRNEIKVKLENKMIIKEKNYSLDQIYAGAMKLHQCSFNTKRKLDSIYREHIITVVNKDKAFKDIKFSDIQLTLNGMTKKVRDDTIKRCLSLWKRLYLYAIASDIVMRDETIKVQVPKSEVIAKQKRMNTSIEEIQEVIEELRIRTKSERHKILFVNAIVIMYYTGMRPSEVFGLEESNIDIANRRIYVCQRVGSDSERRGVLTRTKTEDSIRVIPMSEELVQPFEELMKISVGGYLFIRDNGEFLSGTEFSKVVGHVSNHSFRAYMLRHQLSTDLLTGGTDLRTVQELMGHKDSSMTLSYARSSDELKVSAINSRNKLN